MPKTRWFPEFLETWPSLEGKVIAITGCTSGTGYVAAEVCVRKGAQVILMLNRTSPRADNALEKLTKIKDECESSTELIPIPCDLKSLESVKEAAEKVIEECERFGGVNVLANNAGVGRCPDERTVDGYDITMQINYLSHYYLTQLLMPLLKQKADDGEEVRFVQHSSGVRNIFVSKKKGAEKKYFEKVDKGKLGGNGLMPSLTRYGHSKLANAIMAMKLAEMLEESGDFDTSRVKSVGCAPGLTDTSIFDNVVRLHKDYSLWERFQANLFRTVMKLSLYFQNCQSQEDGAIGLIQSMIGENVENGDFFMPEKKTYGKPYKEISRGKIVEKPLDDESNTLSEKHGRILIEASEEAFGSLFEKIDG